MAAPDQQVTIDGRLLKLSRLDKILYPSGFTKGQAIDYYIRIAPYLLPHFKSRPVTLKRFPDGVHGQAFYEKDAPGYAPEWVATFPVPRHAGGTPIRYILINDLATLVWCANIASLELHPFLHTAPNIGQPRAIVFDLDPGAPADIFTCAEVALHLKSWFDRRKLKSLVKVSGSKGLQLYVPLNTAATYEQTRAFAHKLAEEFERRYPDLCVAKMDKSVRGGKVFIYWSQNADFKTTIGVYSLRAKVDEPFVSMPVSWGGLKAALSKRDRDALFFTPEQAIARAEKSGDLFAPLLKAKQKLPAADLKVSKARTSTPALEEFSAKRAFAGATELESAGPTASHQGARRRFVIQKHAASHLHYDLRLEMNGVLKSWAVPKGVPYALDEKRLAMATEDHPLAYLDFEGVIPPGEYGGGSVQVWDIGTWELMEGNYYKGMMRIFLEGHKVRGEWTLRNAREQDRKNWFLIKSGEPAMPPAKDGGETRSALSGRTIEEIAANPGATWRSNRTPVPDLDPDTLPPALSGFIPPMQCESVADLPEGPNWQYEIKLDGYRALAYCRGANSEILSRNNNRLDPDFPALRRAIEVLETGLILDGEIVALDPRGRPSFNALQNRGGAAPVIAYYVFDVIGYRGKSLAGLPLRKRREVLEALARQFRDPVRLSAALNAPPADIVAAVREQGLEGVVAKRLDSLYEPGLRSGAWRKMRLNKGQELVIGGYIPAGDNFQSLLAGYYEGDRLIFIAKIKNGFVPETRRAVFERFRGLGATKCPFANLPEANNARRGKALTAEAMKDCCWLKPELIVRVDFAEWTKADHLRHSKFAGLREDKDPREVVKEQ